MDIAPLKAAFAAAGHSDPRLVSQMAFLFELEKLKAELRQTLTYADKAGTQPRRENAAEHSWHVTTFALLLAEYARKDVNILRVTKMLLFHDVVEIDAGDTDCYSPESAAEIRKRETHAAERIFSLMPLDQAKEYKSLWKEFTRGKSSDARFAGAVDRVHPILVNFLSGGKGWHKQGIPYETVVATHAAQITEGAPELWTAVKQCLDYGRDNGFFPASGAPYKQMPETP